MASNTEFNNELNSLVLNKIIDLRLKVLYPSGNKEKVIYPKDKEDKTVHFTFWKHVPDMLVFNFKSSSKLLFSEKLTDFNNIIATGTLISEDENEQPSESQWRIRGMAVDPSYQGQGFGQKIVKSMVEYAQESKSSCLIWCNARVEALTLYQRFGFKVKSEVFIIPGSGPHRRMHLDL